MEWNWPELREKVHWIWKTHRNERCSAGQRVFG